MRDGDRLESALRFRSPPGRTGRKGTLNTSAARPPAAGVELEQSRLLRSGVGSRRIEPKMPVRLRRRDASARRALEKSVLYQERLVTFLERARVFSYCGCDRGHTNRTALELLDDRLENSRVHIVEPELIDLEQLQRVSRNFAIDASARAHLRKIANAAQQSVRDA